MAVLLKPLIESDLLPVPGVWIGCAKAQIKKRDRLDLTLFRLSEKSTVSGVFTQNAFCAAPVHLCKTALEMGHGIRALVINTGVANAGTGESGMADAKAVCVAVAKQLGLLPTQVLPFSTGVILDSLPVQKIVEGLPEAYADLSEHHFSRAARAIMTTDTLPKAASRTVHVQGHDIVMTGISKGAGMIKPNMATMLGFIALNARISPSLLDRLVRDVADLSFNCISIDGDTSTNDSFVVIATGETELPEIKAVSDVSYIPIRDALLSLAIELAQAIVRDGEGATKFITITIEKSATYEEAKRVAYAIAHSPLVKTAFFASDPNLGRILAAIGYSGVDQLDIGLMDVYLDHLLVASGGGRAASYDESIANAIMKESEITIRVILNRGESSARVWTCDFSYDYVKINAEYRS